MNTPKDTLKFQLNSDRVMNCDTQHMIEEMGILRQKGGRNMTYINPELSLGQDFLKQHNKGYSPEKQKHWKK